jgi:glyoxylase-like metal-dependent hydrolase (beta-lactamase superfamily II)
VRITDRIHLVGSGQAGFSLTDDDDCHVYLLDGGEECALIDAGGGRGIDAILANIEGDGLSPGRVRALLLTHAHADHAAGAAGLRERLGLRVVASPVAARYLREGDERAISLAEAKRAGIYPADFRFSPCPVDAEVADGATVRVGDLTLEVIDTPGHASGHVAYVLRRAGQVDVFCGDAVFFGGRILLQATWDCSVQESVRSVERLAALSPDGLYPGHLTFSVHQGRRQLDKAMQSIRSLLPPPQML